jgi:hypothetical protein
VPVASDGARARAHFHFLSRSFFTAGRWITDIFLFLFYGNARRPSRIETKQNTEVGKKQALFAGLSVTVAFVRLSALVHPFYFFVFFFFFLSARLIRG